MAVAVNEGCGGRPPKMSVAPAIVTAAAAGDLELVNALLTSGSNPNSDLVQTGRPRCKQRLRGPQSIGACLALIARQQNLTRD